MLIGRHFHILHAYELFIHIQMVFVYPFSTYPTWYNVYWTQPCSGCLHLSLSTSTSTARHSVGCGLHSLFSNSDCVNNSLHCLHDLLSQMDGFELCLACLFLLFGPLSRLLLILHWSQRSVHFGGYRARSVISCKLHVYPHIPVYFIGWEMNLVPDRL